MSDIFPNAEEARQESIGTATVLAEVQAIQNAVLAAIADSNTTVTVGQGASPPISTTMTSSNGYFNAWNNSLQYTDPASIMYRAQMTECINYFARLNYQITREPTSGNTLFDWVLNWS